MKMCNKTYRKKPTREETLKDLEHLKIKLKREWDQIIADIEKYGSDILLIAKFDDINDELNIIEAAIYIIKNKIVR